MKWTKEADRRLISIPNGKLTQEFPGIPLATLQRRRRLIRAQRNTSDGVTLSIDGLENTRFDPNNFSAVVIGDVQSPFHDTRAISSLNKLLEDLAESDSIDLLIANGDIYDCYAISSYRKEEGRGTPEAFKTEMQIGTNLFKRWRDILGPHRDIILIKGNHETRWDRYLETVGKDHLYAVLGERMGFREVFGLNELDVHVIPYKKPVRFGDVTITHGTTSSKAAGNVARNAIQERFGTSVILNHCHTAAMVTQRYIDRVAVGIENFTLCSLDGLGYAEFPNWAQGFTVLRVKDGKSYIQPVAMVEQSFYYGSKFYAPEDE